MAQGGGMGSPFQMSTFGQDGMFTPTAMATAAAQGNPMLGDLVTLAYAKESDDGTTQVFVEAVEERLQQALLEVLG